MKLYAVNGSPNCRKIQAVLNHLKIDAEIEWMDFFTGELKHDDFLAMNPNGKVPVLKDGDFVLWESNAIMQYIADQAGDTPLFPRDPARRANIVRWQCWELAHFNHAFGTIAFEAVLKTMFKMGETNAALVEANAQSLNQYAAVLERHLSKQQGAYVTGDDVTLADYSIIHMENFKEAIPLDWSPYPAVNQYFDRVRGLNHWSSTAPSDPSQIGRRPQRV